MGLHIMGLCDTEIRKFIIQESFDATNQGGSVKQDNST